MKTSKLPLFLLLFWLVGPSSAVFGQEPTPCYTVSPSSRTYPPPGAENGNSDCYPEVIGPFYIRIYVHMIVRNDDSGGYEESMVRQAIDQMKADFLPHNIFFVWDYCDIDRIPDSGLYNNGVFSLLAGPDPFFLAVTSHNPHADGIDIYLLPSTHPVNAGRASDMPGKALVLGGSFPFPPYTNYILSHVLSHEMGHCLGLYHTFQPWDNCPDGEYVTREVCCRNCCNCGDLVCDTRAYPNAIFYTDYETCDFDTQGALDVNEDPFDPDETLIMNYIAPGCMLAYTPGQGARMRYVIQAESADGILSSSIVAATYTDLTITSPNETWTTTYPASNGKVKINGTLTVADGAILTINPGVSVSFGDLSKMIIRPNGRVILHGTLTSLACGQKWKGVEIWGKGNNAMLKQYSQYPNLVTGECHQGRLDCKARSIIENADIGAKLWGPTVGQSGGQIFCDQATFRNNRIHIDFKLFNNFWPYSNPPRQFQQPRDYFASFTNCTFIINDNYPHTLAFHSFLKMEGVNGVSITGGSFKNMRTVFGATNIGVYGYGIQAAYSGFRLSGATFQGLGYGIYAFRTTSPTVTGTNRPYLVNYATFKQCYLGIYNSFVSGSTIIFNNFQLGEVPDLLLIDSDPNLNKLKAQVGLHFDNSIEGFGCEENRFIKSSNQVPTTLGVVCRSTGDFSKCIRKNYFTGITIGNLANETNGNGSLVLPRGLLYECNQNADIQEYDFAVKNGSISRLQGKPILNTTPPTYFAAGNKFSYPGLQDFYNDGPTIDYYYNPAGANEKPLTYSGFNGKPKYGVPNGCASGYYYCADPPCTIPIRQAKADFLDHEAAYNHLAGTGGSAMFGRQMAAHRLAMDTNAAIVLRYMQADTLQFDQDSLNHWIGKLGTVGGDIWLAGNRLAAGNLSGATSILNGLGLKYSLDAEQARAINDLKDLFNWLDDKDENNLGTTELEYLKICLDKGSYTQAFARNILRTYGYHFTPEIELPAGEERSSTPSGGWKPIAPASCQASPNPARDLVAFSWNIPATDQARIEIYNASGMLLHTLPVSGASGQALWRNSVPGLYFYRLMTMGGVVAAGKIIFN